LLSCSWRAEARHESEPGEVKHLSTQRKRKNFFIPLVAASEKGKSPNQAHNFVMCSGL